MERGRRTHSTGGGGEGHQVPIGCWSRAVSPLSLSLSLSPFLTLLSPRWWPGRGGWGLRAFITHRLNGVARVHRARAERPLSTCVVCRLENRLLSLP